AGLGWITKFSKSFTNHHQLKIQSKKQPNQKLVGFILSEVGIPRKDYLIYDEEGNKIGIVTSGTQSPTLNKGIGMGYIKTQFTLPKTKIYVKIREKTNLAEIVSFPFASHK
ncbi:MAG: glycine cleavage T C-terminal barrel domain-containing protein, partial [Solirubrobacteraceae bacterium]